MSSEPGIPAPDLPSVKRRYIDVDGTSVHYRVAGNGQPVVMLHDSPRSSRLHLKTMQELARDFRVYALDTPGYGNSQSLVARTPTIHDFALALGRTIDALNLAEAPLYATHTSAKIALEYAARVSDSTSRPVILDGLSIPTTPPDRDFIAAYMRPFVIDAAGGYLAAEWTRMRDMLRWFPWFDQRTATRMPIDQPDPEWIGHYMIDFLSAGPSYSSAYSAAMYYDPGPVLLKAGCPVLIAARSDDVLYASLDKVPVAENPMLKVERLASDRNEWLLWLKDTLRAASGLAKAAPPLPPQPALGASYVDLPGGQIHVRRIGDGAWPPLLILAAPTTLHALAWQEALPGRNVLVPDLPGFGESTALDDASLSSLADAMAAMLEQLALGQIDVLGTGFAGPLAMVLTARHPQRVRSVVLDGAFELNPQAADALCPHFAFDSAGGHVHRYWHMLRDGEANWPWFVEGPEAHRALQPRLSGQELHDALVGILKQEAHYGDVVRAACQGDLATRYPSIAQPVMVFTHTSDPGYRAADAVIAGMPSAQAAERPATIGEAARMVEAFLAKGDCTSTSQTPPAKASA